MSPRGWRRAIKVICVLNETCEGMYGSFMRAGGGTHDFVHLLCTALYWVETSPRASEEAAVGVRVGWYVMGWGVELLGYRGQRRASRDLCLVLFLFSHHAPKNARARRPRARALASSLRAVVARKDCSWVRINYYTLCELAPHTRLPPRGCAPRTTPGPARKPDHRHRKRADGALTGAAFPHD